MSLLRLFIAVEIPSHIQHSIQQQIRSLRQELDSSLVRWVDTHNIHLTLNFLGDVSPANVDMLTQILRVEADLVPAFDMQIGGFGSFPNSRRPRVLWVGIQAPAELEALNRGIESACARLGYESDARGEHEFHPHLTIGRIKQELTAPDRQKIRRAVEAIKIDSLGVTRVDSVHLYKSDLKPYGSVYTKLFSAPLHNVIASEAKQ
jgi:2'-5' RNA ligase